MKRERMITNMLSEARAIAWLVAFIAISPAGPALAAGPAPTPELDAFVREAKTSNPRLGAARRRWEAARARVQGEGLLPDPMLSASFMNLTRLQGPQLTASQAIPLGGKLDLARAQAEREAEVARFAYLGEVSRVVTAVKTAYFDLYALHRQAAIVAQTKELMTRMSRIAAAKYAVGTARAGDPLRANVQIGEMLHEAVLVGQRTDAAAARLRGLLSRRSVPEGHAGHLKLVANIPLTDVLPAPPPFDQALAAAEAHNPAIGEARAMLAAGEATLSLARTTAIPDLNAQVGVGRAFMDMGWETTLSGMVGVNVPFPNGQARRKAATTAAATTVEARRLELEDRRREVRVGLEETLGHLKHLAEQLRLYQRGILPQSRQALQAELAGYQTGRSDFDAWLAAQVNLYRYERDAYDAFADYHKMRAELDALTGAAVADLEEAR